MRHAFEETNLDFGGADYADLFSRADATVFQDPRWMSAVVGDLLPSLGCRLSAWTARDHDGRLIGVAPLVHPRRFGIHLLEAADAGVIDYNVPVLDRAALRRGAIGDLPVPLAFVRRVRAEQAYVLRNLGLATLVPMGYSAHAARMTHPFEDWRAAHWDLSFRRYLDRKRRRLQRDGVARVAEVREPRQIEEAFTMLRAFRAVRWPKDLLGDPRYMTFYRHQAVAGAGVFCRTYILTLDDVTRAVAFGLTHSGAFHLLLLGFEAEEFRNRSLGLLLLEDAMRDSLRQGDAVFDFTIGDQEYKRQFGTQPTPMLGAWGGPWLVRSGAGLIYGLARLVRTNVAVKTRL